MSAEADACEWQAADAQVCYCWRAAGENSKREYAAKLEGRIERDDWVGQARRLMAEATAGEVPAEEQKPA